MADSPSKERNYAIVAALVLAFILLAFFLYYPKLLSPSTTPSPYPNTSITQTSSPSSSLTPLNTSSPSASNSPNTTPNPTQAGDQDLVNYALSLINADRQQNGVENVTLSSIDSGQRHADDMLKNHYFSHWDINSYKPYVRYTLAGGKGAVDENIAATIGYYSDLKKAIANNEYQMMHDDAEWNWGHRDNIINSLHNKVSIGIAYDSNNIYFVEDFESDYIAWTVLNVSSDQVALQGTIQKQGSSTIQSVAIFYDNLTTLTPAQVEFAPYNGTYDPGTYVGLVLPPGWQAPGAITITADNWNQNGGDFQISFSLSKATSAYGKGVYTLYVELGSSTADALTNYSIFIT